MSSAGRGESRPSKGGGGGGGRGRGGGGGGGRGGGGRGGGSKKESILELAKLIDSNVRVKCLGGRELRGALRGYDELVNLVLDDCDEFLRDPNDPEQVTNQTRRLGLVVIRGTQVSLVSPEEGTEEIANPFLGGAEEEEDAE
ncbi:hypothetical protein ACHAWF_002530 [Thalassiosira exigua]